MDLFQKAIDKVNKLKQAKELAKGRSPTLKKAIDKQYAIAIIEYDFQKRMTILKRLIKNSPLKYSPSYF